MKELDCRGMACPKPVLTCRQFVAEKQPETFTVLVDNLAASENVSRFLRNNGYDASVVKQEDALWQITALQKDGGAKSPAEHTTSTPSPVPTGESQKILVFITTETLGRGDDTLGTKLMENFLGTLPELGADLWMIILVNGGVRLAAKDGKALEHLQALAKAGTTILVCGTCLSHYGLLESKKVGETTNMLDIVTSLSLATKVIRP